MNVSRRLPWIGLLLALIFGLQLACNLPTFGGDTAATAEPTGTKAAAASQIPIITIQLTNTPLPSSTPAPSNTPAPTSTPLPPTALPPTATQTATHTATPVKPSITPTATPKPIYSGFIAYNTTTETLTGFDFKGVSLNINLKISGAGWVGPNEAQWANKSIYYVNKNTKRVAQIAAGGGAQVLNFIPAKDNLHFAISPDGKKIAWSFENYTATSPASELWIANIDGTGSKKIAQIDAAGNTKWLVVQPYRWLSDGRLLYIDAPTGIGGYILFYGFAGLHVYDPASAKTANLTPTTGAGALCLREVAPDLKTVLSTCGSAQVTLNYITLANNQVKSITRQPDQNQTGSPAYSPSGAWLAYAYALGEMDNEKGKVALVAAGETTPKLMASITSGYFNVVAWINESQFLVERFQGESYSVWLFNREGPDPIKLADGLFLSFIP